MVEVFVDQQLLGIKPKLEASGLIVLDDSEIRESNDTSKGIPDSAILEYLSSHRHLRLITKDRGLARKAKESGLGVIFIDETDVVTEAVIEALRSEATIDDITFAESRDIRLKLVEVAASSALQYAALAVGMAILWGALLQDAGNWGNNNPLWLVEGVLTAGMVHATMNSAFYGRYSGLAGAMMPSAELETISDPDLPYPRDKSDKLTRLNYRYHEETKKRWFIAPFGNVFSWKFLYFVVAGMLGGWFVATPNQYLQAGLAITAVAFSGLLSYRAYKSTNKRFAKLSIPPRPG